MRIKVTKFGLCSRCERREKCEFANDNKSSACGSNIIGKGFKEDKEVRKKIDSIHADEVESFLSLLKRTDRNQVNVTADFHVVYTHKPDDFRKFNSRSNTTLKVPGSNYEYIRYCENCGAKIRTVNSERRLCDDCHDEICEMLGVSYANEPKYRSKSN